MSIAGALALTGLILLLVTLVMLMAHTDSNFKFKSPAHQRDTWAMFALSVVLFITSVWTAALS